tara:strand:- start:166 stop:303 length:138 start_codon:yes stop_codon:yes gene_type:complete
LPTDDQEPLATENTLEDDFDGFSKEIEDTVIDLFKQLGNPVKLSK